MVCGWGSVKSDDQEESFLGNASSSKNLHCMYLSLASVNTCRPAIQTGDFRTKLICGVAENQEQATTWVIVLNIFDIEKMLLLQTI